jgi:hypothetical protein
MEKPAKDVPAGQAPIFSGDGIRPRRKFEAN